MIDSNLTIIFDTELNEWSDGPPMLQRRSFHGCCAIKGQDGATKTL